MGREPYRNGSLVAILAEPQGPATLIQNKRRYGIRRYRLSGRFEETNFWLLPEIEPRFFARPAHDLVTIPAEVTRL